MKKTAIALALTLGTAGVAQSVPNPWTGAFCMFDGTGGVVSDISWGTLCDEQVTGNIDTAASTFSVASTQAFFGNSWTAHNGVLLTPGTYTVDSIEGGVYTNVTVGPGQLGGHILFDWGSAAVNIDVIVVWDITVDATTGDDVYTSSDVTAGSGTGANTPIVAPSGWPGLKMIDGAFPGFSANFNMGGPPPLGCQSVFVSTNNDTAKDIDIATDLLSTCTNAQGALTLDTYTQPANGTVTKNSAGTILTYTPDAGVGGLDNFTYTAMDTVMSATAGVDVQVGGVLKSNFSMLSKTGNVFGGTNDVDIKWDEVSYNTNTVDTKGIANDLGFDQVMTIASPQPFFNFKWKAHHVRVFQGPGTFKFDSTCTAANYDAGKVDCNNPFETGQTEQYMTMTLAADEVGGHILFDWGKDDAGSPCGKANCYIDVVNVWKRNAQWNDHGDAAPKNALWLGAAGVTPATDANWKLVSTDFNGDGNNASPMIDGAFLGSYANFNYKADKAGTPPPPYNGTISSVDVDTLSFSTNLWMSLSILFGIFGLRKINNKK